MFKINSPCHDREFVQHPNPIGNQFMWMCPHCWQPYHELIIRALEHKKASAEGAVTMGDQNDGD